MLLLTISSLALLGVVNYLAGRKQLLYPPVVFCSVWAADLLLVKLAGDFFYPVAPETLFIFLFGALAFSAGSWLALLYPTRSKPASEVPRSSNRILSFLLVIIIIGIPFCYRAMVDFSSGYGSNYLSAIYVAQYEEINQTDARLKMLYQFDTFAIIIAMVAFFEAKRTRKRAIIAVCVGLVMSIMTGGRAGIAFLIMSLLCLDWFNVRRIRWRVLTLFAVIMVVLFGAIAMYVGKGDARPDASFVDNLAPVARGLVLYASGGMVAFDRVVREPNIIPHNWQVNHIVLQTLNKMGGHFEVPYLHAQFVTVGPSTLQQNVYTFYFAYIDWGITGMMLLVVLVGFIVAMFYRKGIAGDRVSALVYSGLFFGTMMTPYNESFFLGLNMLAKVYAAAWLFYRFPAAYARLSQVARQAVQADL